MTQKISRPIIALRTRQNLYDLFSKLPIAYDSVYVVCNGLVSLPGLTPALFPVVPGIGSRLHATLTRISSWKMDEITE